MDSRLQEIVNEFSPKHFTPTGDGVNICCPLHADKTPSCSIWFDVKGRLSVHCNAGCNDSEVRKIIIGRVRITSDVVSSTRTRETKSNLGRWVSPIPEGALQPSMENMRIMKVGTYISPESVFEYRDENGKRRGFMVLRYRYKDEHGRLKKDIRPLSYRAHKDDSTKFAWVKKGVEGPKLIYGLENLAKAKEAKESLLIVEGEKCADIGQELQGICCLTWQSGTKSVMKAEWDKVLSIYPDPSIILWADADEAGRSAMKALGGMFLDKKLGVKYLEWGSDGQDIVDAKAADADILALVHGAKALQIELDDIVSRICLKGLPISCKGCVEIGCPMSGRIYHSSDIAGMSAEQHALVYNNSTNMFHNVFKSQVLPLVNLDNAYRHRVEYRKPNPTLSMQLLDDDVTTKVDAANFWPEKPKVFIEKGLRYINDWNPIIPPTGKVIQLPDRWFKILEHVVDDEEARNHVVNWLGFTLQHPGQKINHACVLVSDLEGLGKSALLAPFAHIMGSQFTAIGYEDLISDFNSALLNKKLVVLEELHQAEHRRAGNSQLKKVLASPPYTLEVNIKYGAKYSVQNICNFFGFSNHQVPILFDSVSSTNRRWFIYESTRREKLSSAFWRDYFQWLDAGGAWDIYHWLMSLDVSSFEPGEEPPVTAAKEAVAKAAEPILEVIIQGIANCDGPFEGDLVAPEDIGEWVIQELGWSRSPGNKRIGEYMTRAGCHKLDDKDSGSRIRVTRFGKQERLTVWACRHAAQWRKRWKRETPKIIAQAFLEKETLTRE